MLFTYTERPELTTYTCLLCLDFALDGKMLHIDCEPINLDSRELYYYLLPATPDSLLTEIPSENRLYRVGCGIERALVFHENQTAGRVRPSNSPRRKGEQANRWEGRNSQEISSS